MTTPVSCVIAIVFSGDLNYNENAEPCNTLNFYSIVYKIPLQNNLILIKVCQAIIRARYFPFVVTKSRVDNVTATTLHSVEKKT